MAGYHWMDKHEINNIRIEVITMAGQSATATGGGQLQEPSACPETKNSYDKAAMGAPCGPWNRDWDTCDKGPKGESHFKSVPLLQVTPA